MPAVTDQSDPLEPRQSVQDGPEDLDYLARFGLPHDVDRDLDDRLQLLEPAGGRAVDDRPAESLLDLPVGCTFAPRCVARVENRLALCTVEEPALLPLDEGHDVRCWLYHDHPPTGFAAPLSTFHSRAAAAEHWAAVRA